MCWMFGALGTSNPYFWDVVYDTQRKQWMRRMVQLRFWDAVQQHESKPAVEQQGVPSYIFIGMLRTKAAQAHMTGKMT